MGWAVDDALLYRYRIGCVACNGTGVFEPYLCPVCEDAGRCWMYRAPTPADLLTDPRVRALVEALQGEAAALRMLQEFGGRTLSTATVAALAPFEEVPRVG